MFKRLKDIFAGSSPSKSTKEEEYDPALEYMYKIKGEKDMDDEDEDKVIEKRKSPTRDIKLRYEKTQERKEDELINIDMSCLQTNPSLTLRDHQLKIVNFLLNPSNRGVCCSFPTGTGKTLTAVACAVCLLLNGVVDNVIVVTPLSVKAQFSNTVKRAYFSDEKSKSKSLSSAKKTRFNEIMSRFTFVTKEMFSKVVADKETRGLWCNEKTMLIIDEAHHFRTFIPEFIKVSKRTGIPTVSRPNSYFVVNCSILVKKILLLTATPIFNSEVDILNLAAMVKGEAPLKELPISSRKFDEYFRNVFAFFEQSDVVDTDMAALTEIRNHVEMPYEYYKEYYAIEKNTNLDFKNPTRFLMGLRRATNVIPNNPKVKWIMDRLTLNRRTLIYSAFLDSGIRIIQRNLNEKNIKWVEITGKLTDIERSKAQQLYNSGKVKIIFITKAGGEGLDLKGTRDVILMESSWNKAQEDQVIGRARRSGSHAHLPPEQRNVEVYHLVLTKPKRRFKGDETSPGSADEIMQMIVAEKESRFPDIIDSLKKVGV